MENESTHSNMNQEQGNKDFIMVEMDQGDGTYKVINGKPKYYTTGQVAEQLGENDSTIRFWCDEFDDFLHIEKSGRNRTFKDSDIKKIEYIKYLLKSEGLSIRQVKEYLSTPEAELMQPIMKEKEQLMIKAISQIVSAQVDAKFAQMEDKLLELVKLQGEASRELHQQLKSELSQENQLIKDEISKKTQEAAKMIIDSVGVIDKRLADSEEAITQRDDKIVKMIEDFRARSNEKPKGFLSKLFNK